MNNKFKYIKPDENDLSIMDEYREKFSNLYDSINTNLIDSREKSLVLTKLEEASLWLNKAIMKID